MWSLHRGPGCNKECVGWGGLYIKAPPPSPLPHLNRSFPLATASGSPRKGLSREKTYSPRLPPRREGAALPPASKVIRPLPRPPPRLLLLLLVGLRGLSCLLGRLVLGEFVRPAGGGGSAAPKLVGPAGTDGAASNRLNHLVTA